ncbi:Flp family type IVb pilin [Sphingomonas sp. R86521]|uniref:Flp family type IVb pilin n=1 Tax=Sphingomonas sp. R86521 TaxID=3093860 RepID=UPI0036D2E757
MKLPMPAVKRVVATLVRLTRDRRGATAIEYGLILALVFLGMLLALTALADKTIGLWNYVDVSVAAAH